jgi:hypothetical protein
VNCEQQHPGPAAGYATRRSGHRGRLAPGSVDPDGQVAVQPGNVSDVVAQALAQLGEGLAPINELVIGQRLTLVNGGISPTVADDMVQALYEQLITVLFLQLQSGPNRGPGGRRR